MTQPNAGPGRATYQEIVTQSAAWEEALDVAALQAEAVTQLLANGAYTGVIFTGCGSTYYLSLAAAALWQTLLPTPARAAPAGEIYLYPDQAYGPRPPGRLLLIAVSRSGATSETVAAVQQFRNRARGDVIVVTNYGDSPLGALGDVTIAIPGGQEESVAQTRSFASMYVAITALIVALAHATDLTASLHGLPAAGRRMIAEYAALAQEIGADLAFDRFYFLGSGPRYGLACEINLKMKEMTLTHSEPFHFFEFRHGPMSMVNEQTVVVGFVSEQNYASEMRVLLEMKALGGKTISVGEKDADICFASALPEPVRNVLYLPVLQLMAFHRARAKGLNPDRPTNLTAVVQLDLAV